MTQNSSRTNTKPQVLTGKLTVKLPEIRTRRNNSSRRVIRNASKTKRTNFNQNTFSPQKCLNLRNSTDSASTYASSTQTAPKRRSLQNVIQPLSLDQLE